MSYATLEDLIGTFGAEDLIALTDRADPPSDTIDEAAVASALSGAQSLIDGYLAGRYATPLATVPDIVQRWTLDLARHGLYLNKNGPTEAVQKAFLETLRQLRDAADGRLTLAVAGVAAPAAPGGGVKATIGQPVFDARTLGDYR